MGGDRWMGKRRWEREGGGWRGVDLTLLVHLDRRL